MQPRVGALVCAPPLPQLHTGDWRGCWPAVTRSSLAVPLDQDHEGEFALSSLGLFAVFLLSLSLSLDVQPAACGCGGATVAFCHVSDAAGYSGLFLGLPFF